MNQKYRKRLIIAALVMGTIVAALLAVTGAFERRALAPLPTATESPETGTPEPLSTATPPTVSVLLDGEPLNPDTVKPLSADGLKVSITLDGKLLLQLPFAEPHAVTILQPDGSQNTVRLTGDRVFMESSTCDGQDCVQMGEVTRDNLELRVLGGFIICLPHRLSVEVWE